MNDLNVKNVGQKKKTIIDANKSNINQPYYNNNKIMMKTLCTCIHLLFPHQVFQKSAINGNFLFFSEYIYKFPFPAKRTPKCNYACTVL